MTPWYKDLKSWANIAGVVGAIITATLSYLESQNVKDEALTRDEESYAILVDQVKRLQRDLDQLENSNVFLADSLIDIRGTLREHTSRLNDLPHPEFQGEAEFEEEDDFEVMAIVEMDPHVLNKLTRQCIKAYRRGQETLDPDLQTQILRPKVDFFVDRKAIQKCLKEKFKEGLKGPDLVQSCTPSKQ